MVAKHQLCYCCRVAGHVLFLFSCDAEGWSLICECDILWSYSYVFLTHFI